MDRRGQLSDRLKSYRPTDPAEQDYRRQMLALLAGAGDPFSREHFAPGHFTASAFVVGPGEASRRPGRPAGPELLMIHHRRLERWLQPGGHIEPEDTDLEAAAWREVREETGLLDLNPIARTGELFDLDIHPIPARPGQPRHLHLDVRFLFQAGSRRLTPATEVTAARWVTSDEAAQLNAEAAMSRVLDKLRAIPESRPAGFLHPRSRGES